MSFHFIHCHFVYQHEFIAQDLIGRCLERRPSQRISLDEIKNHPWLNNNNNRISSGNTKLPSDHTSEISSNNKINSDSIKALSDNTSEISSNNKTNSDSIKTPSDTVISSKNRVNCDSSKLLFTSNNKIISDRPDNSQ
jgi:serine/threonine protein kinase